MTIHILVKDHQQETHRLRVSSSALVIGRSSKCHLTLADPLISGQHLSIFLGTDGRTVVKDLGSTNGIYLNGSRVEDTAVYLDDVIQFGNIFLKIDSKEMTDREKSKHTKDYEKTHVTFVNMGPELNNHFADEVETKPKGKKTLLGEIRKQKLDQAVKDGEVQQSKLVEKKKARESLELKEPKKGTKKKSASKEKKKDGVQTQIKKLFKI